MECLCLLAMAVLKYASLGQQYIATYTASQVIGTHGFFARGFQLFVPITSYIIVFLEQDTVECFGF